MSESIRRPFSRCGETGWSVSRLGQAVYLLVLFLFCSLYDDLTYSSLVVFETHILRQQVRTPVIILEQADIPALVPQRPPAPQVLVLPAHRVPGRHADLGLPVRGAVDVRPEDVLPGRRVVDDLGPLQHPVGPQVARRGGPREQGAHVGPRHQVRRGVAVDVLEGRAVRVVLPYQVVCAVELDDARAVGLDVLPGVGLRVAADTSVLRTAPGSPIGPISASGHLPLSMSPPARSGVMHMPHSPRVGLEGGSPW